jgi:hypothetical protein
MIDWSSCPAVERDPEKFSGSWLFRGTRVPVVALFEAQLSRMRGILPKTHEIFKPDLSLMR